MPKSKRKEMEGRGSTGKTAVVGAKDRDTKLVSAKVVEDTTGKTLLGFIRETVVPGAEVRGGPGKLDHLLRWLRPESERMRSHGKTKEFLSSV